MTWLKGHWQILVLGGLIIVLWQTPVVVPLKILIVFLHELGHAIATVVTGGRVLSLTVDPMQGGMVVSQGGNRFLILTAGYLGSLGIGVLLLFFAIRTHLDRAVLGLLGAVMIAVATLYVRDSFAVTFTLGTGAVMLVTALLAPRDVSDLILRIIGLASMIYVPWDIFSDTIARSHLRSDARMLAEEFIGTTTLWGGLWLILSLLVIGVSLWRGLGAASNIPLRPDRYRT